jgi:hypothetical protein
MESKPSQNNKNAGQTPFDRFKAALSQIVAVPKSSLPKSTKKPKKK